MRELNCVRRIITEAFKVCLVQFPTLKFDFELISHRNWRGTAQEWSSICLEAMFRLGSTPQKAAFLENIHFSRFVEIAIFQE